MATYEELCAARKLHGRFIAAINGEGNRVRLVFAEHVNIGEGWMMMNVDTGKLVSTDLLSELSPIDWWTEPLPEVRLYRFNIEQALSQP